MGKIKAVVLEKSKTHYNVLDMDGTFRQVKQKTSSEVGDEIEINVGREGFPGIRIWTGVVALFLMVLTSILGWNIYQVPTAVAVVSVNINPSLQFTLDSEARLLKLETQNEDARKMLGESDLKGKPIDEVLASIFTMAYDQNFINSDRHWVVVGYSPIAGKEMTKVPKEINETQINDWVTESMEEKGYTPQVAVFTLTSEDRESAQKEDLTIGEFGLWQTAQKAGVTTQPKKLKETNERVRLLENPQVQAVVLAEKLSDSGLPPRTDTAMVNKKDFDKSNSEGEDERMLTESPVEGLDSENKKGRNVMADRKRPFGKGFSHGNRVENEETMVETEDEVAVPEEEVAVPKEEAAAPKEEVAVPKEEVAVPEAEGAVPKEETAVPEEEVVAAEEGAIPEEEEETAAVLEEEETKEEDKQEERKGRKGLSSYFTRLKMLLN